MIIFKGLDMLVIISSFAIVVAIPALTHNIILSLMIAITCAYALGHAIINLFGFERRKGE